MNKRPLIVALAVALCWTSQSAVSEGSGEGSGVPAPYRQERASHEKTPAIGKAEIVVPSDGLPPEVKVQNSNNNLDAARHGGRVFLAFRTSGTHFAGPETELYVVSSADQKTWRFEGRFHRNTDLREPRLLAFKGRLFLYFAVLGDNPRDFQPQGMMKTEYRAPGDWSEPEWALERGAIPWRLREIQGVAYMMAYRGGENLYDFAEGSKEELYWMKSADGWTWEPVVPEKPVVHRGGCSETDFAFLDDGSLAAVCRNELGDADGFGSKICRAPEESPGDWSCRSDPKKYDSPLVFRNGGDVYLVGRRNVGKNGAFDLGRKGKNRQALAVQYQLDYWKRPKRCSLWLVDPKTLTVKFAADLPSKGDTCFASVLPEGEGRFTLYNYTSPLDGPDVGWNQGQLGRTEIYRLTLDFGAAAR